MSRLIPAAAALLVGLAGCGGSDGDASGGAGEDAGAVADAETGAGDDSPLDVVAGPDDAGAGGAPEGAGPDDGPEDQAPIGTGQDTAAIAGLWDYTREVPEGTDIAYFEISGTGTVTEYDYQGDDVGSGADCYVTFTASIASNGGDRYDIQDASALPGADSVDDVRISVEGGSIVFRYIGDAFDPEFGEGMAGVTETYPAAGVSPADFAICD